MYPFDFRPKGGFIDPRKIFVAMPFTTEHKSIYTNLIKPAVDKSNLKLGLREKNEKLWTYRADDPKYTRSGWLNILENMYTSRIVLGVLTGNNPNVFYELGIAHATQQIERQLLIAEKGYRAKFDLKDLIYREYDPRNISASIDELSEAIIDTLDYYDLMHDRMVSQAEAKLGRHELGVIIQFGGEKGNFYIPSKLPDNLREEYLTGLTYLCHSGLTRLSTKQKGTNKDGRMKMEYSYYWTDLGNAVLCKLGIITEETQLDRRKTYWTYFDV